MTNELIALLLGSNLLNTTGTAVVMSLLNRKKTKAEVEQVATKVMKDVLETVSLQLKEGEDQRNRLVQRSDADEAKIATLERQMEEAETRHQECELNYSMLLVELDGMRRMVAEKTITLDKLRVAVLDDSPIVTYVFEERLKRISLLDVKAFTDVDAFLKELQNRPEILIVDYHLGRGVTLEAIMHKIVLQEGYHPKIVVITADKSVELREAVAKLNVWRFYVKEGPYVNQVTKQIMDLLANFIK